MHAPFLCLVHKNSSSSTEFGEAFDDSRTHIIGKALYIRKSTSFWQMLYTQLQIFLPKYSRMQELIPSDCPKLIPWYSHDFPLETTDLFLRQREYYLSWMNKLRKFEFKCLESSRDLKLAKRGKK